MIREYQTVASIAGPLMLVEGVAGVKYQELVQITLPSGEVRRGQVLEVEKDRALVQVFEGTTGIDVPATKVRFMARGITIDLSPEILGRVFGGLGRPRDGGPAIIPDKRTDVNGAPINPYAREYPNEFIQTGVSPIDA
jgi:V/A-type H+-transporting ATPase subunit B